MYIQLIHVHTIIVNVGSNDMKLYINVRPL